MTNLNLDRSFYIGFIGFNTALESFELGLNIVGYISPSLAREIRCCYGFAQIITACAINIIASVGAFISQVLENEEAYQRFTLVQDLSHDYMHQGAFNIIRSFFEGIFGYFMLLYDICYERHSYAELSRKIKRFQSA